MTFREKMEEVQPPGRIQFLKHQALFSNMNMLVVFLCHSCLPFVCRTYIVNHVVVSNLLTAV